MKTGDENLTIQYLALLGVEELNEEKRFSILSKMACGGWAIDLNKREHKNWLEVGCGTKITKNAIAPLIQNKMEAWHQGLITNPPLSPCKPCTCVPGAPVRCTCKPCICVPVGLNCVSCRCPQRRRGGAACGSCVCPLAPVGNRCPYCATWKGKSRVRIRRQFLIHFQSAIDCSRKAGNCTFYPQYLAQFVPVLTSL